MTILDDSLRELFPGLNNVLSEANKKLASTYCFLNGKIQKCREFREGGVVYHYNDTQTEMIKTNITSFNIWLPESGLYQLADGSIFLVMKQPNRQWARSFSDSFYEVILVSGKFSDNMFYDQLAHAKKLDLAVTKERYIFWWNHLIGYIKDTNTIICTNMAFKQELIDWSRGT